MSDVRQIHKLQRAFELYARLRERMEDDQICLTVFVHIDTHGFYQRRYNRYAARARILERYILGHEVEYYP
jgi:hypothetical protein